MKTGTRIDLARAEADPAAVFRTPQDVLDRRELSREQTLRILERWKLDALDMEVAAEENMAGGENSMLALIYLAIGALDGEEPRDGTKTTKHGFREHAGISAAFRRSAGPALAGAVRR